VDLGEPDRTPPPMKPLPPVGSKVASPVPPAARVPAVPMPDPVVSFETPRPVPAPRPSVPFAIRSAAVASSPSAPFAVPGPPPGPLLSPGALPTPQPVSFAPFGGSTAEAAPSVLAPAQGRIAALFQRQPGLKYVVAVLAIVGLIILLGLVILRGGQRTTDSEPTAPAEPEPAKAEEPKPAVAETPPPPPPAPAAAPAPQEKPAPVAHAGGKPSSRSSGRSGRHAARTTQRAAPERAAPERQEPERPAKDKGAAPPRLAGARPNPFDESRSVSQAQITAVVRNPANQAGLKSCYERALKMDNHLTSGRIDVTVSIAASGAVQRVVINAPSSFILVEPCIKSAVKRWSFPPNTEDYGTNFPLIMQGGM
jgi:outer membrane biosynthesis protein TonB